MTHTVTCVPVSLKEKLLVAEVGRHLFYVSVRLALFYYKEHCTKKRYFFYQREKGSRHVECKDDIISS